MILDNAVIRIRIFTILGLMAISFWALVVISISLCLSLPLPSADPTTIDRCGISSPPLRAFKIFRQSLKFWQTLFVVTCIHVSTVLSHQSVNQYQSFAADCSHQMQDFAAKMHQTLPPPKNATPGADLRRRYGRTAALPSLSPIAPVTLWREKEERECARDRKTV